MRDDDLLRIIQKGESEISEFKENFDKETIETVVAFTNTKGGVILIGISDEGARIDLNELVKKGLFQLKGGGRGAHYVLK